MKTVTAKRITLGLHYIVGYMYMCAYNCYVRPIIYS